MRECEVEIESVSEGGERARERERVCEGVRDSEKLKSSTAILGNNAFKAEQAISRDRV